ncbi:MAG: hypothetical protein HC869_00485 [Rhodospirillales bacterium]|nr:hypothetical protein [Rhodospirillales bacterium]
MEFSERSLRVLHFDEPQLEFAHGQTTPHPKDGLFLFGPFGKATRAREIRLGLIGTPKGIDYFKQWGEQIKKRVDVPPPGKSERKDRIHLANFPGLEEAYGITFDAKDLVAYPIDPKEIDQATRILNLHEAVSKTVKLFASKARRHFHNEERSVDVWILIIPEIIFDRCRPGSKRLGVPMEKVILAKGSDSALIFLYSAI